MQLTVTKIVQIKNCSSGRYSQQLLLGSAFHAIIVRGMKENLKESLWGRMGVYF